MATIHSSSGRSDLEAGSSRPTLRRRATGAAVNELQHMLAAVGFSPGAIDGRFGAATELAVNAFQRSRKLAADGIVGPRTWSALDAAAASASWPPAARPTAPGVTANGGVSLGVLRAIMQKLPEPRARVCLPYLNDAMDEASIDTRLRRAAFLAQLAHESGEFRYFEELASGGAYEGRLSLGNTRPGDGRRYKGRGPIQLTGRNNYRAAGLALGLDLENTPERAADIDVGFRVAGWFWTSRKLNPLADAGNFAEITRRINGAYNGLSRRRRYYERALELL